MSNGGWTYLVSGDASSIPNGSSTVISYAIPFTHSTYLLSFVHTFDDTWDGESAYANVDGVQVWSQEWYYTWHANGHWGHTDEPVTYTGTHQSSTLSVTFGNTLNQDDSDESGRVSSIFLKIK